MKTGLIKTLAGKGILNAKVYKIDSLSFFIDSDFGWPVVSTTGFFKITIN